MPKSCVGSYVVLDPRVHLAATLGLYAVLLLVWATMRLARVQPIRPQSYFHGLIAALTPVAAVMFFVILQGKDLRVDYCSFTSASHMITLVVDIFFFLRLLVEILEGHLPEPIPTLTDGWLLVNTTWKITHKVVISEYHFMVLVRFAYPQTLEVYAALLTRLFGVSVKRRLFQLAIIIVGVFVFAGAIQTAEEWSQLLGIHPDAEGQVTAWHSFWDYIYMGYVTVSTVGYGDMSPSTVASQAIVIAAIVGYIAWYSNNCEELFNVLKGITLNVQGHVPPLPRVRRLVVIGCLETNKTQQLVDHLAAQEETQIIIGINRDESLSLQQVPGVFVISTDLNRSFFKRCFLGQSSDAAERPSYSLMILNQQGDGDEVEARHSDLVVLSLVQLAKAEVPDVAVVAQVWRSESHVAVLDIEGWVETRDQVVCNEDLIAGLMAQTVAAEGATSILATLIACPPCTAPPKQLHACTEKITSAYLRGQGQVLTLSDSENAESESFEEAALQSYLVNRTLLLGYVQVEDEDSGKHQCHILPAFIPPKASRIIIVPPDLDTAEGLVNSPATHRSKKIESASPGLQPPNVCLKQKTVRVLRDGPAGRVVRLSRAHLRLLTDEETDSHVDVAAMLEPQDDSSQALYRYYCAKADLAETSPGARVVTNVEHGMNPCTWMVSAGSSYSSTSFVNSCVVTSAVILAYSSGFHFSVWKSLVEESPLVEVEVKGYYCYKVLFQFLLTQRHMLPLGATIQMSTHSRPACRNHLNLDPDDEGSLAVTNPDFNFCLHPGDKVIAFPFREEMHSM